MAEGFEDGGWVVVVVVWARRRRRRRGGGIFIRGPCPAGCRVVEPATPSWRDSLVATFVGPETAAAIQASGDAKPLGPPGLRTPCASARPS